MTSVSERGALPATESSYGWRRRNGSWARVGLPDPGAERVTAEHTGAVA